MKKALLILGGVMLLTLGAVGMASANAGPHGNYGGGSSSPDGCAGCHRAHTAIGPYLLAAANPDALCEMCHGATGTTDVFDGILTSNNATLNGGGFDRMGGTTTSGTNVASRHDVEGVGGGTGEAWGSNSSGRGVTGVLECINCHNPHGSTNYRILTDASLPYGGTSESIKWVSGSAGLLYWQNSQVLEKSDQPTTTAKYAPGSWAALSNTYYTMGINNFCATCHKQYVAYSGSYKNPSTDSAYYAYTGTQDIGDGNQVRYRHATSKIATSDQNTKYKMLRFAVTDTAATKRGARTCLTCHFAHGSTASAGTYSAAASPAGDSATLLYANRGVCQACHNKS